MSVIDEVRKDHEDLARVLNTHTGIRKIVEDLYPDSAHFIYELLQNAEDTGASTASFSLSKSSLTFEHNGRTFDEKDLRAITNIGESTKGRDDDKIGRFGVGFKAVFAYSETPQIWSPSYSFKISDLFLPHAIPPIQNIGKKTKFEFPFNNPKKAPPVAYKEILSGLRELAETTLLFLSHLESISWKIDGSESGEVLRYCHSSNHFEVLKQVGGKTTTSLHFLKYDQSVIGLEKQKISVAYALDYLPDITHFDEKKPLSKQIKIVPAIPGKVAVFFPAEKETSGLRFHLHGPFVPELSRASIKETPANLPIFEQISSLVAKSLHDIRDLKLLTADFLGVLPNPQDQLPERYECIRTAIVDEMNQESLTPTFDKSHAPAAHLLQARAIVKNLLSKDDIELLVDYEDTPPNWAIGVIKGSNAERFLDSLEIVEWDIDEFLNLLCNKTGSIDRNPPENVTSEQVKAWLINKPAEWHQQFCALLFDYMANADWFHKNVFLRKLKSSQIIKLSNNTLGTPDNSYFPSEGVEHDDVLPRVDSGIYSSGRSKVQQENARKFLIDIGVKEVGEVEQIKAILETRYSETSQKPRKQDLKRFVTLLENNPDEADMFEDYYIFERADGKWGKPGEVYLDSPFVETGLKAYYEIADNNDISLLSEKYIKYDMSLERIIKFSKLVGIIANLTIENRGVSGHPNRSKLLSDYYKYNVKRTITAIDDDWYIKYLSCVLNSITTETAKLVWSTMIDCESKHLEARFRPNQQYSLQIEPSSLVLMLRDHAWIPQIDGNFVLPAEADSKLLPSGFLYDSGWDWLEAIHFAEEAEKKSEELRQKKAAAETLGVTDYESLEIAKQIEQLPPEQKQAVIELIKSKVRELPENEPLNPSRRAERVGEQAAVAPERKTEERTRSVSVGREAVKQETAQYLRQQYTNHDGEMICQICKQPVPFKLDDGSDYFEKVEFLECLTKRHYQNYLALCPNHSAMFKLVNGSKELMKDMFVDLTTNELEVILAQSDHTIYFTKTHIADLKSVINSEDNSEASD